MTDNRDDLPIVDFNSTRALKTEVRRSLDGHCLYCGCRPTHITVDHVVPECKGGTFERSNLVPACRDCNLGKGDQDLMAWWREQPFYCHSRVTLLDVILGDCDAA